MCSIPSIPDRKLSLFEPAKDYRNAGYVYHVDKFPTTSVWGLYANGYLKAVNELIETVLTGKFPGDTFGYPIFFLFSHYLELRFKEIIQIGRPLIGEKPGFSKSHNLTTLWGDCNKIFKEVYEWKELSDLDKEGREIFLTMDHFIKELSQDSKAQTFRYPVDKNGQPLIKDSIMFLNIENMAIVVNWLSQTLDGLCTGVYENKRLMDEYHAELRAEYDEDYWR